MSERLANFIRIVSGLAAGGLVVGAIALLLLGSSDSGGPFAVVLLIGALAIHILSRFAVWLLAGG